MSQFLSQTLSQQMRLQQRLTPQLIQSMTILQKPIADLEAYIEDALESNAALELAEPQPPEPSTDKEGDGAGPAERPVGVQRTGREEPEAGSFARLYSLSRDYDWDANDRAPSRTHRLARDDGRDAKMAAMANTASRAINLHEHLLEQWALADVDEPVRHAGEAIINHLDPDGYLRVRLETIADRARDAIPLERLQRALAEVQKLDPPGVGAQDAVECLLLQLDALPGDNHLERTLIERHLDDIANNRLPEVAKATGYSTGEITEAMKAMRATLCLHPGYLVGDRSVPPIRPDVIVDYADTGDGLTIRLARGSLPRLRIRDDVVKMAKSKGDGKETREFARKHVEEASHLIDAVRFRQDRLLEVARAVVEKQRDFFDVGPQGLKVLRMGELALELGCDPSTVSRTVADKYVQTPRGIYPLRYFFTGGTETQDGKSMGWRQVKLRVRELVEAEDRKNPLSDEQLMRLLKKEGIEISRRTVAKYRQQLDIPAARRRREF